LVLKKHLVLPILLSISDVEKLARTVAKYVREKYQHDFDDKIVFLILMNLFCGVPIKKIAEMYRMPHWYVSMIKDGVRYVAERNPSWFIKRLIIPVNGKGREKKGKGKRAAKVLNYYVLNI